LFFLSPSQFSRWFSFHFSIATLKSSIASLCTFFATFMMHHYSIWECSCLSITGHKSTIQCSHHEKSWPFDWWFTW
jgi:hypothetical protein